jgi:hypothetical protein
MRVWLPDRPGALGALASCIGERGVEIVGIDILERDGARAVDELTLEVADARSVEPLVAAVVALDGFDIEDMRPLVSRLPFPGGDPLDAAVGLIDRTTSDDLFAALSHSACAVFAGDWAAVLDCGGTAPVLLGSAGNAPAAAWLGAFVGGAQATAVLPDGSHTGPRDVAWAALEAAGVVAVVGRDGPPFRSRERRELSQLCRIADVRWRELALRSGIRAHPSRRAEPAMASGRRFEHPA